MKSADLPRISFGIIVLNGEPFTEYCLRSLYPYAHEILVVEGAVPGAQKIATPDGHSTDGTLDTLKRFKENEDPENKIQIITRNGFWPEKDEQSQAYASQASGDYLWQVDVDEFFREEDMNVILQMLQEDPEITAVSFRQITFWGGFDYSVDGWFLRNGADEYHRLFRWGPGYQYRTHRPPTVCDSEGRDLRSLKWKRADVLEKKGIFLYHYSLVFPKQVQEKAIYYSTSPWPRYSREIGQWAEQNFLSAVHQPYRVHNVHMHPSWIQKYEGMHPAQIQRLQNDLQKNPVLAELRNNQDIQSFESFWLYRFGRWLLKTFSFFGGQNHFLRWKIAGLAFRVQFDSVQNRLYVKW